MARRPTFDRPIAHRGLHNRAAGVIENSRSAFETAISGGFAIECDVQLSHDSIPMIFHDDQLERLTGRSGPIGSLTADELGNTQLLDSAAGDTPQRLTDFLAQVAGRTLLQIELKRQPTAEMREALARTATAALAGYEGPVTVESFDPYLLTAMRARGYRGPLGIITYDYRNPEWDKAIPQSQRRVLRHLLHWPWTRFDFISCQTLSLGLPAVRFFRALGVPVTAWTVKSPQDRRVAAAGADQIVFEGFDPRGA
jgi:glycerophosphoryl diester phosphodiesterase